MLTLAGLEVAYRVYLYVDDVDLDYIVMSRSVYEFDREHGYRYTPNATALAVRVNNGALVEHWEMSVNANGNIGAAESAPGWEQAAFKILVVGDSFTARADYGGITWTDYLPAAVEARRDGEVALVNLGRDGFGILQMIHLAQLAAVEYQPDLLLIAFITNDLTRASFWRTLITSNGEQRLLASTTPTPAPDLLNAADVRLINPLLSNAWAEQLQAHPVPEDPLLQQLNDQFRRIALAERRRHLFSLQTSLLYNRLFFGDPFFAVHKPARNPRLNDVSNAGDPVFQADITALQSLNIPVILLRLPQYQELKTGEYRLSAQESALLTSLQAMAQAIPGSLYVDVLSYADGLPGDIDSLFALPYDRHPSQAGVQVYAALIDKAFADVGMPPTPDD